MRFTRHILLYALIFFALPALGKPAIVVTQVNAPVKGSLLHLEATADIRLPDGARTALDNGIDLFFETIIQVRGQQKLLPDKKIAELRIQRRISFHALTNKYTVDDLTYGTRKNFSSLFSALAHVGKYQDISLFNISLAKPFNEPLMRMRIKMSRRELPFALRLKSYLTRDWYLSSDWYVWPLP